MGKLLLSPPPVPLKAIYRNVMKKLFTHNVFKFYSKLDQIANQTGSEGSEFVYNKVC